jgi:pimeloyl-ACP methyl ester carboxylesterase
MSGLPDAHLVLIHGALGTKSQLASLASSLRDEIIVYCVELEGHGSTLAGESSYSIDRFAGNVRDLIMSQGLERTVLFGYSMGGYVALKLADEMPELVTRVATLGTKLAWSPEVASREKGKLDAAKIREKVPAFALDLEQRHRGVPGGWESVLSRTAALMTALGDNPLIDGALLSRIRQPVRLMVGDRDAVVTIEETASAARSIPGGSFAVLPGTPHPVEQVRTPLLRSLILDFLHTGIP